jgi:hypothetical protein
VIGIYAITDHPPAMLPADLELRAVGCGELVAFCGPGGERRVSPDLLWRHEQIIETLMKTCDLLPVRYGTQVEDEPQAMRILAKRRAELLAALNRIRGAVELSVRVAGERDDEAEPAPSGADYLRAKARATARKDRLADRIHKPLDRIARASRRRNPAPRDELMRAAYLVDRGSISRFAELVALLQRANDGVQVLCTGPWPPYSFVGE